MQPRLLPVLCALALALAAATADESAPVGDNPELAAQKDVSEPTTQETSDDATAKAPSAVADYKFLYEVHDPETGDIKSQSESRFGDKVKGEYVVTEPDGTLRTVEYAADKHSGFSAVVKKSGPHKHITSVSSKTGDGNSGGVGDHQGDEGTLEDKQASEEGDKAGAEFGEIKSRGKSRYFAGRGKSRGYKKLEKQEPPKEQVSESQMFELISDNARPSSEQSPPATNPVNLKNLRNSRVRTGRGQRGYTRGKVENGDDGLGDQGRFELLSEIGQNGQSGLDGKEDALVGTSSTVVEGKGGRVEYDVFINHAGNKEGTSRPKVNLKQVSPPGKLKIIVGEVAPLLETGPMKFPSNLNNLNNQNGLLGQGGFSNQEEFAGQNGISGQGGLSSPNGQGGHSGQGGPNDQVGLSGGIREQGGFRPLGYAGAGFGGQRPLSPPIVVANPVVVGGRGTFGGLNGINNGLPNQGALRGNIGGQGVNEVIKIISRPNIQPAPNGFGSQRVVSFPSGFGGLGGIAHIPGFGNIRDLIAQEGLAGQVVRGTRNPSNGQKGRGQGRLISQKRSPPYMIIRGVVRTRSDD